MIIKVCPSCAAGLITRSLFYTSASSLVLTLLLSLSWLWPEKLSHQAAQNRLSRCTQALSEGPGSILTKTMNFAAQMDAFVVVVVV